MTRLLALLSALLLSAAPALAGTPFSSGFEGGSDAGSCATTGWDGETDTGNDMELDDDGPVLRGSFACKLVMNDTTTSTLLESSSLTAESEIWVTFYIFIVSGGTYVDANAFQLLQVRDNASLDDEGNVSFRQVDTSTYWGATGMAENDDASQVTTSRGNVMQAGRWYCFEYNQQEASSSTANNGELTMYVDGRLQGWSTSLDNNGNDLSEIRLGDTGGLDATPAMTIYFDEVTVGDAGTRPGCTAGINKRGDPEDDELPLGSEG